MKYIWTFQIVAFVERR